MTMQTTDFFSDEALPPADPSAVARAHAEIIGRHVLAMLRAELGMTLKQVAAERGVTKAAVHQIENKPLGAIRVSSMLDYLRGLGYDVDEEWLATAVYNALPNRT